MGLHVTPYGTFYVQRSLRTGEIVQVLPVKRPPTPSHLPSVDALGITDTFIERRRARLVADTTRASTAQERLQSELASAGGERLLETGKAVLAQRDGQQQQQQVQPGPSRVPEHGYGQPSGGNGQDVEMAYTTTTTTTTATSSSSSTAAGPSAHHGYGHAPAAHHHHSHPAPPPPPPPPSFPPAMAMEPPVRPVRPWPDAL